jgi:PLP dependent protein
MDINFRIAENLAHVRGRIAEAAGRAGRPADAVKLVAVTKYVTADAARALVEAGCHELGESRPQQLWEKAAAMADLPVRWHLIGHLQRNKLRRTLPLVGMFQSLDSLRLLDAIEATWPSRTTEAAAQPPLQRQASAAAREPLPVLLEVNISGETAKHGFPPDALEAVLAELPKYRSVTVCGLMGMAALEGGAETARRDFAALRALRDRLRPQCPPGVRLDELSMGMSGDFETAIEEGATIVRVGSALFEGRSCCD